MAIDLRWGCDECLALPIAQPKPGARRRLLEALLSKWEGVRITAYKVLLEWVDEESVSCFRGLHTYVCSESKMAASHKGGE